MKVVQDESGDNLVSSPSSRKGSVSEERFLSFRVLCVKKDRG